MQHALSNYKDRLALVDSSRRHLQAGEPRGDLGDLAATWVALGVKVRVRIRVS